MAKPVSKTKYLALIGGGFAVGLVLVMLAFVVMIGGAAAEGDTGQGNAAAEVALAAGFGLLMLANACMLVPAIAFLVLLYKAWQAIQDGQVRTSPAKAVGFMLIPLFSLYWMFPAIWGWAQDYNAYTQRHGIPRAEMSEGLFLAFLICVLVFFPGAFVLMFVIVARMCDGINTIAGATPRAASVGAGAGA